MILQRRRPFRQSVAFIGQIGIRILPKQHRIHLNLVRENMGGAINALDKHTFLSRGLFMTEISELAR